MAAGLRRQGLSPRVRGKRWGADWAIKLGRSIPACAGETTWYPVKSLYRAVYPRVCGGNVQPVGVIPQPEGLSPRVRGKRLWRVAAGAARGSIPACAGETGAEAAPAAAARVYPRVCGGNAMAAAISDAAKGLSPRVRGKRLQSLRHFLGRGSIPACAGETTAHFARGGCPAVYPRVCGGNRRWAPAAFFPRGLSPRVRGKHSQRRVSSTLSRSIPACAGETRPTAAGGRRWGVYPRVCGGNGDRPPAPPPAPGLSPRVRGKPQSFFHCPRGRGSIPACAGETPGPAAAECDPRVYPRVCGGNHQRGRRHPPPAGLSPRVRGKLPLGQFSIQA